MTVSMASSGDLPVNFVVLVDLELNLAEIVDLELNLVELEMLELLSLLIVKMSHICCMSEG